MNGLGAFLERQRELRGVWLKALYGALAALVLLNLVVGPHEPHFGLDAYPGFWALFGLVVGVLMVVIMKRVVQPVIVRREDHYGDI